LHVEQPAWPDSPPPRQVSHDWKVEQIIENDYRLYATEESIVLELLLHYTKGPILNGIRDRKKVNLGN
jgi:hypothetical protein